MGDTKERILLTALDLFAREGYEGVSVRAIGEALGMTKGALYRHYRNKQDIFDSITARMEQLDQERAREYGVPEGTPDEMGDAYRKASLDRLTDYAKAQFRYWTEDPFASSFRKLLTLEQFRNREMGRLYQQYLAAGPLGYMADLFSALDLPHPQEAAAAFYGPMFLFYTVYDGAEDKAGVLSNLDNALDQARAQLIAERKRKTMKNEAGLVIRRETPEDHRAVENLVREAFWNVYRPGCLEHYVLHRMRTDPAFVPELDLVLEKDGVLIGQNVFFRAEIRADDGRDIPILTMGPISIAPAWKRQGFGKYLLDHCLKEAAALGYGAVCFEGNMDFYGKSGFTAASTFGIRYRDLPPGEDASFFLCRELVPGCLAGVTGEYGPPPIYFVCDREPEDFARFEGSFPPKEKLKLPGQLF